MESLSYKNFYLDVKGKDIYFIWVWLKSRKAELKQLKQISQNMLACLVVRLQLQLKIYLHKHKLLFFQNSKESKQLRNTPLWCLNFSFSIHSTSNLNCLQGRLGKSR